MKEAVNLFIEKLKEDEDLVMKIYSCKSPEEAYAIASSVQDGFTFEEFVEGMTSLRDSVDKEISDNDLEKAAGGVEAETVLDVVRYTLAATAAGA